MDHLWEKDPRCREPRVIRERTDSRHRAREVAVTLANAGALELRPPANAVPDLNCTEVLPPEGADRAGRSGTARCRVL